MLEFDVHDRRVDTSKPARVLVYLHGLGGNNKTSFRAILNHLDDVVMVVPNAPIALGHTNSAFAWYFQIEDDVVRTEMLLASCEKLHELIQALPDLLGFEPLDITLTGFSQGGTMSTTFPLVYPEDVSLSAAYAGYIALDDAIPVTPEIVEPTRFFWAHGQSDYENTYPVAVKGMRRLVANEAHLCVAPDRTLGHNISHNQVISFVAWWDLNYEPAQLP